MKADKEVELPCANGQVLGALPEICVYCGASATGTRDVVFFKESLWARLLFGSLFGLLGRLLNLWLTARWVRVHIPVCKRHEKGFERSANKRALGAFAALILSLAAVAIAHFIPLPQPWDVVFAVTSILVLLVLWFRYIHWVTGIRAKTISEAKLVLVNVAPEFATGVATRSGSAYPLVEPQAGH
jgi:hypothetical protein